jgi:hypothetical protein
MEEFLYFLIVTLPLILLLWVERKNLKTYLSLGIFTMVLATVWEPIGVYTDLWHYFGLYQFLGVSIFTLLAYFHWISFSYFLGNRFGGRLKK